MNYKEIIPRPEQKETLYFDEVDFIQPILVIDRQNNVNGFITKVENSIYYSFQTFFKGSFQLERSNDGLNDLIKDLKNLGYKCITNVKFEERILL